ncbi:MAG: hypothetical protein M2R45_02507 [Verrucomicrobia subdivision 3 bacterium]|nr:hypothetical protein [Limisphaerales bacterium]
MTTVLAEDEVLLTGLEALANGFTVAFLDVGSARLDPATVSLTLDGVAVTGEVSKDGDTTTVTYRQDEFFAPGSTHVVGIMANEGAISKEIPFTVPSYVVVGAEHVLSGDFSERGFLMRVVQSLTAVAANSTTREAHLAGTLRDADGEPLENLADLLGAEDGVFAIEGVINFSEIADPQGVFRESGDGSATDVFDDYIPGIPGLEDGMDHVTAELLTVIEIPEAGLYNLAFNSDDGFRTTAGMVVDVIEAIELGVYEGTRGASTTYYNVLFEEAGFYKLRTLWWENDGGANLEWWLADQDGNPIALLNDDANGGLRTFRDVPEEGPAEITSISPADGAGEIRGSGTSIIVTVKNGSTSVDTDSPILTTLNGEEIDTTSSTDDGVVTITAETGALQGDTEYRWEMSFKVGERTRTISSMFRTTMLAGDGLVFIEAEDFDYELGNWDQTNEIGMNGAYPGGTYQDLGDGLDETDVDAGTSYGVDYFESNNTNSQAVYRPDTGVEAGKMNGPAGQFRGEFNVEINHVAGWNDAGDWYNYTRNFPEPAQNYNVFGRLSSGGQPIHSELHRVTSGVGTSNQETELLGTWQPGRNTGGWDTFEIFPLLNAAGNPAVVNLGGEVTLRYVVHPGNVDEDYFVFFPASGGIWNVASNGDGTVTITFGGTLSSSETVDGMYQPIPEATSPYTTDASDSARFYIAR